MTQPAFKKYRVTRVAANQAFDEATRKHKAEYLASLEAAYKEHEKAVKELKRVLHEARRNKS